MPSKRIKIKRALTATSNALPIYNTFQHSHTQNTSNYNPNVSLGNAKVQLIQMRSELPILSAQVSHALSNNPLFER